MCEKRPTRAFRRQLTRASTSLAVFVAVFLSAAFCNAASPDSSAALQNVKLSPVTQEEKKAPEILAGGLGLLWMKKPGYTVRPDYAWRSGGEAAADHGRLWLQAKSYF